MRVIAGRYGGRRIRAPAGTATRPTSDRVREALFQVLGPLDGARVLDLFAGSGALGLEALSRGAGHVTFVERDRRTAEVLRRNLDDLAAPGTAVALRVTPAARHLRDAARSGDAYDLVLLDPPYRDGARIGPALGMTLRPLLRPGSRVVTESDRRSPIDLGLDVVQERRYGDTLVRIHQP